MCEIWYYLSLQHSLCNDHSLKILSMVNSINDLAHWGVSNVEGVTVWQI